MAFTSFIAPIHTASLHLPQMALKVNIPSHCYFFGEEERGRRGSEGAAYQQLAAAKTLPSEVSGGEQRRLAQKKCVAS